jgi:hypothetical protein
MAVVISLEEARRRRAAVSRGDWSDRHPAGSALRGTETAGAVGALDALGALHGGPQREPSPQEIARLERAVTRLDALARPEGSRERLRADVERDLLTVVGELAMGWIDRAADRAEELCDRLADAAR